jgi:hypothetical protein
MSETFDAKKGKIAKKAHRVFAKKAKKKKFWSARRVQALRAQKKKTKRELSLSFPHSHIKLTKDAKRI